MNQGDKAEHLLKEAKVWFLGVMVAFYFIILFLNDA